MIKLLYFSFFFWNYSKLPIQNNAIKFYIQRVYIIYQIFIVYSKTYVKKISKNSHRKK